MSRTYALALIFATVTLISGLFYGQYRYLTDGREEVTAYAAGVHERVVAGQLEEMARRGMEVEDRLQEDSKARFLPILPCLSSLFDQRDNYLEEAEKHGNEPESHLTEFQRFHNAELDSISKTYTAFLREFGGQMDLRLEDINAKVAYITKAIEVACLVQVAPFHSTSEVSLTQDLLTLDYLEVLGAVVQDVIELSGGKIISCSFGPEFFPIMVTNIENPRRGETVTAKVWVGSYSTSLNPENVILSVGNDTLKINPDGTADYIFTPKHRGKLEFNMEMSIINPLTGMVTRGKGVRRYNIR